MYLNKPRAKKATQRLPIVCSLIIACGEFIPFRHANATTYTAFDLFALDSSTSIGGVVSNQLAAGGQVVGSFKNEQEAYVQSGPGSAINLTPSGFTSSDVASTDGVQQIGYGSGTKGTHALLWNGSPSSVVDLTPTNISFVGTIGEGLGGGQEVGSGNLPNNSSPGHALLWNGSSTIVIDLNPTNLGVTWSGATGTDGVNQVGWSDFSGLGHAFLWSGTAKSAIDLNPTDLSNINESYAHAVSGNQEVGDGFLANENNQHALLWTGSAGSAVDLNPTSLGFTNSDALDTNGSEQVGFGSGTIDYALLWNGTAASVVNLGALLPAGYIRSEAYTIDAQGDVFGIATDSNGVNQAVEWIPSSPVPEPTVLVLSVIPAIALLCRRHRHP